MTSNLKELPWFEEAWATNLRNAVRVLVRDYAEAVELVERISKPIQRVTYHDKLGGDRSVWVVKSLLREAVAEHIQAVLRNTALVRIRAFSAARPTAAELQLPVKATAPPNVIGNAIAGRHKFVERQKVIASLLNEAAIDIRSLLEATGVNGKPGQRLFKAIITAIRRVLPFAWAGFVITQFAALSDAPQWQLFAFAALVTVAYHVFAWMTLPFHDAADRQFILFEGYRATIGDASDGIPSIRPEVSRHEKALFKIFGSRPPVIVSWEYLVPPVHYALISFLLIAMVVKLPFAQNTRTVAGVFAACLICLYAWQGWLWWRLLRTRYSDHSIIEILWALHIRNVFRLFPRRPWRKS